MEILKTVNLTKIYGYGENKVLALNKANLEVKQGEFIAILGTSGSGKSTDRRLHGPCRDCCQPEGLRCLLQ